MKLLNRLTKIIFFALLFFLSNCSFAQKTVQLEKGAMPDWVNNPYSAYPEQQYIVGVGSGDTRKDA